MRFYFNIKFMVSNQVLTVDRKQKVYDGVALFIY